MKRKITLLFVGLFVLCAVGALVWRIFFMSSKSYYELSVGVVSAQTSPDLSALFWYAQEYGYFEKHNVHVSVVEQPYGAVSVNEMLAGNIDVAVTAEYPVVKQFAHDADISVLGSIARADFSGLIMRFDKNRDASAEDLRGKRIAFPEQTQSHFALDVYLKQHGISLDEVMLYPSTADGAVELFENGEVDALSHWDPHTARLLRQDARAVRLSLESLGNFYWVLATRSGVIKEKSGALDAMMAGLVDARASVSDEQLYDFLVERQYVDRNHIDEVVSKKVEFDVSVKQDFVYTLLEESRWLGGRDDVLNMLYIESLLRADVNAVNFF